MTRARIASRRRGMIAGGLALALTGLSGCMEAPFEALSSGDGPRAPARVEVLGGRFAVAGPKGYCIDESSTRSTDSGAFVLMGSCSAISGNPDDDKPALPAVLTVSASPMLGALDEAGLDRMAAYLATDEGLTALARSEAASDVAVIDLGREPGLVLVHARDSRPTETLTDDYWRGVFDGEGVLVTVTVAGFAETPLDEATGQALLRDLVAAIRGANGIDAPGASGEAPDAPRAGLAAFFNRLL